MAEHQSFHKQSTLDAVSGVARIGDAAYRRAKKIVRERSGGICEIGVPIVCKIKPRQFHHKLMRSQGGPDTAENLAHTCIPCHRWVHAHPKQSYVLGWLTRRAA